MQTLKVFHTTHAGSRMMVPMVCEPSDTRPVLSAISCACPISRFHLRIRDANGVVIVIAEPSDGGDLFPCAALSPAVASALFE